MEFKGHIKSSFIDYPDKICTVYFVGGCNFRCPYCHNSHLLRNEGETIGEKEVFSYLDRRKKMLDAVCISGGEPTLQPGLPEFIGKVREMGFMVKLDTNGTNPEVIKELLDGRFIDYIAMDVKAPMWKYNYIAQAGVDTYRIEESISLIKKSGVDYEFRTTVCRELLSVDDIVEIAGLLKGSKKYVVQNFRDGNTVLAGENRFTPFTPEELKQLRVRIENYFGQFKIR